jgi:uncharacterized protein YigE (DUF2233 family)
MPAAGRGQRLVRFVLGATVLAALVLAAIMVTLGRGADPPLPSPQVSTGGATNCEARRFEGAALTVCRFDARIDVLTLIQGEADGRPYRTFAAIEQALGESAAKVRFAMNAGMFDEQGRAIGLFVENGLERRALNRRDGPGNFHLSPNGVFAQDAAGAVHVTTTERFPSKVPEPHWATQSGPMLVIDGELHPRFDTDGPSRLIRNGVGVSDPQTAWFVISEEAISFGRFARFFRNELGCPDALFLDGSVSSLWDPAAGRRDNHAELGPVVVVSSR